MPIGLFRKRTVHALTNVSLRIARGELVVVSGPSGSGKTTLLMCLAALERPDAGSVVYNGQNLITASVPDLRAYRRKAVLLFQHPSSALDPRFTAAKSIGEPLRVAGMPASEVDTKVTHAMQRLGLSPKLAHRRPAELSGGERQRVALARALVSEPELLLADEPVSALDEAARDEALALILEQRRELGFACLLVSHDTAMAERIQARSVRMTLGQLAH